MSRPRQHGNKGLPENLYSTNSNGKTYFRYRRPDNGRWCGMGTQKQAAINAAKRLNEQLSPATDLVKKIITPSRPLQDVFNAMQEFWEQRNKAGKLANDTLRTYLSELNIIGNRFGSVSDVEIKLADIASFIDSLPPRQGQKIRGTMSRIWKFGAAKGLITDNIGIVDLTLIPDYEVSRKRWTHETYKIARQYAPPYIQRAMDLAIQIIQRRHDLVLIQGPWVNEKALDRTKPFFRRENGVAVLYLIQHKTEKHGEVSHLRIELGAQVENIISECNDGALSTRLLHYPPDHEYRHLRGKSISLDTLTRAVSAARDLAIRTEGIFKDYKKEELPTLHELRSLGSKLMEDQGWDKRDIQILAGHSDEKMTDIYLSRYGIQWTTARAGIDI